MTDAATSDKKPRFIADQRLFHLVAPPQLRAGCLQPEMFRLLRERAKDKADRQGGLPELLPGCRWEEVADRTAYLSDTLRRRWCFSVDAGSGKTTALEQAEYLRHAMPELSGHVVVWVKFNELPESPTEYLDAGERFLISRLKEEAQDPLADNEPLCQLIRHRIRSGKFTLIVDALDQTDEDAKPKKVARGLAGFLKLYAKTQCIVSGRPHAIQKYWSVLFQPDAAIPCNWDFTLVDAFSQEQIETYLGPARAELLKHAEAEALAIPRTLRAVLEIPDVQLPSVRTASDIYSRTLEATMQETFKGQQDIRPKLDKEEAYKLFSLLAFEMVRKQNLAAIEAGPPLNAFLLEAWNRRPELHQEFNDDFRQFKRQVTLLDQLNAHLEYAVLDDGWISRIEFTNRTIQDFFAALWLTRYGNDDDFGWATKNVFIAGDDSTTYLREMWKLATGMPGKKREGLAAACQDEPYARSMAAMYAAQDESGRPRRSTEMIYRSWPAMLQIAAFLPSGDWTEQEVTKATLTAQQEAWRVAHASAEPGPRADAALPKRAAAIARLAILDFLGEFPRLLYHSSDPEVRRIAHDFNEDWFQPIPAGEDTDRSFWMGDATSGVHDEARHESFIERRFWLAKYTVTNELYELFDAGHAARFSGAKRYSPELTCPVINVDWYASWCAATWFGGRLPTEHEWEYACRAMPEVGPDVESTRYNFGDDESQLGEYAWWEENSGNRTHPVNGGDKLPNVFGLYHMHGNVWEWTASWYAPKAEDGQNLPHGRSRVLRGGAFGNYAGSCRSAYRNGGAPGSADHNFGFRVARALKILFP